MKARGFHISVTTGLNEARDPEVLGGLSLEHDLQLVKAALLYADDVTLYSPAASMLLSVSGIAGFRWNELSALMIASIPYIVPNQQAAENLRQGLDHYTILKKQRYMTPGERQFVRDLDQMPAWDDMYEMADRMAEASQVRSLVRAIKSGRLHVHDFLKAEGRSKAETAAKLIGQAALTDEQRSAEGWSDELVREYVRVMSASVSGGQTYPLFDLQAAGLLSAGISEGMFTVSEQGLQRGRHSSLAADLLDRLPTFGQATIDEILDIRRELDKPLKQFRKAITNFSATIKTASWDEDFITEADTIFYRDVDPVVQEIEEMVQTNRYLLQLLRKIGVPAGALTAIMSRITDLPDIIAHATNNPGAAHAVGIGAMGAGLATVGTAAIKTAWEKHDKRQEIQQHELYFYYRARKKLS